MANRKPPEATNAMPRRKGLMQVEDHFAPEQQLGEAERRLAALQDAYRFAATQGFSHLLPTLQLQIHDKAGAVENLRKVVSKEHASRGTRCETASANGAARPS